MDYISICNEEQSFDNGFDQYIEYITQATEDEIFIRGWAEGYHMQPLDPQFADVTPYRKGWGEGNADREFDKIINQRELENGDVIF